MCEGFIEHRLSSYDLSLRLIIIKYLSMGIYVKKNYN